MLVSERRICRVLGRYRSTHRKVPRGVDDVGPTFQIELMIPAGSLKSREFADAALAADEDSERELGAPRMTVSSYSCTLRAASALLSATIVVGRSSSV